MIQQLDFWVFHSKSENINWKSIFTSIFFAALFIMDVIWKQPNCPLMGRLMDKEDVIHTHTHTHTKKNLSWLIRLGVKVE